MIVLDSSAVLATLQGEPGADRVSQALATDESILSAANLAEVLTLLALRGGVGVGEAERALRDLGIKTVNVSPAIAVRSAEIATQYPKSGLSLGDRLCLATGSMHRCRILTADRAWLTLSLEAEVEAIR